MQNFLGKASAARFLRFDAMSDGWFMGNDDRNSKKGPPTTTTQSLPTLVK